MIRLAYILAASHSGSTLLSMLLGCHPHIVTTGEMHLSSSAMGDLGRYRCSCGAFIRQCSFWEHVRQGMAKRGITFDLTDAGTDYRSVQSCFARHLLAPLHRGGVLEGCRDMALALSPTWRRRLPEIHRRNVALASTILELRGASVIVDSSKVGLRLKYLLRNRELDVKVIHLLRDGRAVALTYMDPARFADAQDASRREGGMGGDRKHQRKPMAQSAHEWRRCIEEAENVLRCLPRSHWTQVRYEDYCRDPDATLIHLQRFLGVAPGEHLGKFRQFEQHIVGNGMRLDSTSEVLLDERWKTVLSDEELLIFNREAGRVNRRYGYT